jgi:AcrR family transcriptional regulator
VEQLPRGRHGLSREQVVRSQRNRMLRAMADAMVEKGYVGTTVADIIGRAGVSRETFYQQFASKEACYLAAFDAAVELLLADPSVAVLTGTSDRSALDRFAALLDGYLRYLATEPAFARLFLLEVHAVGPAAMRRRAESQQRFTAVLVDVFGARSDTERFACELLVAGISSLVTARLAAMDLDGLVALHAPLVRLAEQALAGPLWNPT